MRKRKLPEGWEWRKLGEIGKIFSGTTPSTSNLNYFNGEIPWLTPADLSNFDGIYISRGKKNISEVGLKNSSIQLLPKDTILFSSRAPIGYVAIAANPITTNQGFKNLVLNEGIDPEYVFYYLKTHKKEMQKYGSGTTFLEVSAARFSKIPIILPPLPVQRRIVEILDQADALRRLRAQTDAETQKLLQSVFYEMFGDPVRNEKGWERKKLGDVCVKIQDGTHFSPKDQNGDIPYITAKNIRSFGIDLTNVTYIPKSIHEKIYSRCDPKKGDVIYIKDGVTAGLAKVNSLDFEFSMLSSIAMLRPDFQKLNPYYLEYYLNHPNVYKKIMERKSGSAITRLILREIREIPIILPPIYLQNEFAKIVLNMEQIFSKQRLSKRDIDRLFTQLKIKAFAGELN